MLIHERRRGPLGRAQPRVEWQPHPPGRREPARLPLQSRPAGEGGTLQGGLRAAFQPGRGGAGGLLSLSLARRPAMGAAAETADPAAHGELHAAQTLFRSDAAQLPGSLVTADPLHGQKNTALILTIEDGGDLLGVKDSSPPCGPNGEATRQGQPFCLGLTQPQAHQKPRRTPEVADAFRPPSDRRHSGCYPKQVVGLLLALGVAWVIVAAMTTLGLCAAARRGVPSPGSPRSPLASTRRSLEREIQSLEPAQDCPGPRLRTEPAPRPSFSRR